MLLPWAITKNHPRRQACEVCDGTGFVTEYENGAPFGEGYWSMPVTDECHCLNSGHCPVCYTHLMPRPWLHHLAEYMFWIEDKISARYYRSGVLVCPWKGNVRRKLMNQAEYYANRLGYLLNDLAGECAVACPLCNHVWTEE